MLFARGWWLLIPALGAVFLPYFAVVIANAGASPRASGVLRPGNIVPSSRMGEPFNPGTAPGDGSTYDAGQPDSATPGGGTEPEASADEADPNRQASDHDQASAQNASEQNQDPAQHEDRGNSGAGS
jgi:hypothetical protein